MILPFKIDSLPFEMNLKVGHITWFWHHW